MKKLEKSIKKHMGIQRMICLKIMSILFVLTYCSRGIEPIEESSISITSNPDTLKSSQPKRSSRPILKPLFQFDLKKAKLNLKVKPHNFLLSNESLAKLDIIVSSYVTLKKRALFSIEGEPCVPALHDEWVTLFNKNKYTFNKYFKDESWNGVICDFFQYLECKPNPEWKKPTVSSCHKQTSHLKFRSVYIKQRMMTQSQEFTCQCSRNNSIYKLNLKRLCITDLHFEDYIDTGCYAEVGELCGSVYFEPNTFPDQDFTILDWIPCDPTNKKISCKKNDNQTSRCVDEDLNSGIGGNIFGKFSFAKVTIMVLFVMFESINLEM